jgi:L-aminopeptidase/D-esterase-like protein
MTDPAPRPCITDVGGVRVGHHQRVGRGWRTGTTVITVPGGATAGVDVRGAAPGTRETDLLHPSNLVEQVHAICLTGGSAFGLAAADGVMHELEGRGIGFRTGTAVIPIVPAAVIYDLGRGGDIAHRPTADFGARATRAARARPCVTGSVGAGTGARAGGLQGGIGTWSAAADGQPPVRVGALAVVNAHGSPIDPTTGLPWDHAGPDLRPPSARDLARVRRALGVDPSSFNTTIGVVATDARLTKAEAAKLAAVAHDGLARAIRPAHSMFDGDTIFAVATGHHELLVDPTAPAHTARARAFDALLRAAAECFARACTRAVLDATTLDAATPAYRDVCASACRSWPRSG